MSRIPREAPDANGNVPVRSSMQARGDGITFKAVAILIPLSTLLSILVDFANGLMPWIRVNLTHPTRYAPLLTGSLARGWIPLLILSKIYLTFMISNIAATMLLIVYYGLRRSETILLIAFSLVLSSLVTSYPLLQYAKNTIGAIMHTCSSPHTYHADFGLVRILVNKNACTYSTTPFLLIELSTILKGLTSAGVAYIWLKRH